MEVTMHTDQDFSSRVVSRIQNGADEPNTLTLPQTDIKALEAMIAKMPPGMDVNACVESVHVLMAKVRFEDSFAEVQKIRAVDFTEDMDPTYLVNVYLDVMPDDQPECYSYHLRSPEQVVDLLNMQMTGIPETLLATALHQIRSL